MTHMLAVWLIICSGITKCSFTRQYESNKNKQDDEESFEINLQKVTLASTSLESNRHFSDFHDFNVKNSEKEHKMNLEIPLQPTDGKNNSAKKKSDEPHSRQKRLLWITDDGRLALPPGTSLTIAPTLALPLVRYPPDGFLSNISVSLPLTCKNNVPLIFIE